MVFSENEYVNSSSVTVSLALVFFISLHLANKALVPIKNSWEKQNAFVADASHELRTPLAVANSNLEIVVENEDETIKSRHKWLGNVQGGSGLGLFIAKCIVKEHNGSIYVSSTAGKGTEFRITLPVSL